MLDAGSPYLEVAVWELYLAHVFHPISGTNLAMVQHYKVITRENYYSSFITWNASKLEND